METTKERSAATGPEAPVEVPRKERARRFTLKGRGLALRLVLTVVIVFGFFLAYDLLVGLRTRDAWVLVVMVPLTLVVAFLVGGWLTALIFYDEKDAA